MSDTPASDILPLRRGGFLLRAVAALVDIGVIWGFAWLISALLGISFLAATPEELANTTILHVLVSMTLFVAWIYFAAMESSAMQATLGKAFMGLYVTDLHGTRVTFLRASARHWTKFLSTVIFFIGYLMAIIPPRRQALHDMLAGCLVLKR
ncbi:MAG: RDD family protein [Rhodospirillaceae bacterium]|jgi:uncharacterized RDD family membrane protein YckC|nr:RDD family protein [Rhodospirillaceae bacterium]MBT3809750.1 RDD family protein [Rhodospirillaceae bacterium]MBT3930256.1 RDD family protein [Rhodospirillaceae bacterium]MBT4773317.1 RDD family protein [Rhodospirillaceae bacterium]MBT5769948.1 RDD family protein [Rhodospirillaceae bacterium]